MKKTGEMMKTKIYYECEEYDWEPQVHETYKGMAYSKIAEEIVENMITSLDIEFENGEIIEIELFDKLDKKTRFSLGFFNVVFQKTISYTAHLKNP